MLTKTKEEYEIVKIAVACVNQFGFNDVYFCGVVIPKNGWSPLVSPEVYEIAKIKASAEGYLEPMVAYDQYDKFGKVLIKELKIDEVPVLTLEGTEFDPNPERTFRVSVYEVFIKSLDVVARSRSEAVEKIISDTEADGVTPVPGSCLSVGRINHAKVSRLEKEHPGLLEELKARGVKMHGNGNTFIANVKELA